MTTAASDDRPLVLIIDEEETARDLYGHWFLLHGFQVACAVGVSGVWWALRRERPQLIITDLQARDLTFRNLIARLQCDERTRCIPVLVVTSSWDPQVLDDVKAVGATAILPKWGDFDLLQSWVVALSTYCPLRGPDGYAGDA
jgi:CheY-like chemotaxis protein